MKAGGYITLIDYHGKVSGCGACQFFCFSPQRRVVLTRHLALFIFLSAAVLCYL